MVTMSQEVRVPVEECTHGGFARIGQTVVSGHLRWYRSTSCSDCGNVEEDGVGFPPEEIRALLLKDGGHWDVVARESGSAAVVKVVKEVLGLSNAEAAAQLRSFPIVFQGTSTEAGWLKDRLSALLIPASVVKAVDT